MPRYCCLSELSARSRYPAKVIEWPEDVPGAPDPRATVPPGYSPIHRFDAPDREAAERYFRRMQAEGCPPRWEAIGGDADVPRAGGVWRFRDRFERARERLAGAQVPANAEGVVRSSPQYRQIGNMLGQVNELYHSRRKEGGVAVLPPHERQGVAQSLLRCEEALATMAIMVAAGCEMIDAAYPAVGIENRRNFRIAIDDPAPTPDPTPDADADATAAGDGENPPSTRRRRSQN